MVAILRRPSMPSLFWESRREYGLPAGSQVGALSCVVTRLTTSRIARFVGRSTRPPMARSSGSDQRYSHGCTKPLRAGDDDRPWRGVLLPERLSYWVRLDPDPLTPATSASEFPTSRRVSAR